MYTSYPNCQIDKPTQECPPRDYSIQFIYLCLKHTYMQIIIKMQKAYNNPLPCRPPFNKVIYIVSEKLHTSRGRRTDKKTVNNKIVTLMRREKQTNTSVVYVSTQKQRHKIKYIKNVKISGLRVYKIIRSYIITFTLAKI